MQYSSAISKKTEWSWSVSKANHSKLHNPSSFPNTDAKAGEADWFYEDLPHLAELTPKTKKGVLFITSDWNAKTGHQEIPGTKASLALEYKMKQDKG